jgi:tnp2 family transposase/uncharacterized protein DUF4218
VDHPEHVGIRQCSPELVSVLDHPEHGRSTLYFLYSPRNVSSLGMLFLYLEDGYRSYIFLLVSFSFSSVFWFAITLSMPTCFCVAHGCYSSGGKDPISHKPLGRNVDGRTYKSHTLADRQAAFRAAEENSEAVLTAQIEEITAHLSASVLADIVSGPSPAPGPLWSRNGAQSNNDFSSSMKQQRGPGPSSPSSITHPPRRWSSSRSHPTPSHSPPCQTGSRRSQEVELIACLSELEQRVNALGERAHEGLTRLGRPLSSGPPSLFPLSELLQSSRSLRDELETVTFKGPAVLEFKTSISSKLQKIDTKLVTAKKGWNQKLSDIKAMKTPIHGVLCDTDHHFKPILDNVDPVLQVTFFLVVTCQVLLGVSRRGCSFLLQMVQYIINLTLLRLGPNLSQGDEKLLSGIPTDPRTTEKAFNLRNEHTVFAVCPKADCHFNYKPTFHEDSPIPLYPATCNHREFRGGPKCGTPLVKPRRVNGFTIKVPIKSFVAFSFKHWLGGMLARSGFEKKMDNAWVRCGERVNPEMKDIFDAEILRNFKGLDGRHFSDGGEEGRYVFSLCIDYFNPLGNKQAGKKKSIGLISMVCLNLPPEMRYKPENMFLFGIIPGPNEPPLACFNHYLHILIEELLEFWHSGVKFSRTSTCYYGRVVRCALICVVSDLLAARKVNGFAAIGHTQMCAICHCKRQQQDNLNDSFASLGERRTGEEIRQSAQLYLDAENEKGRKETVTTTGIRWSELYRLPYFDPSRMVVVDSMHNLFLGLVQEHFEILGIRMDNRGKATPALSIKISTEMSGLDEKERKSMDKLIETLESPMNSELESQDGYDMYLKSLGKLHKQPLKLVFESFNLKVNPNYTDVRKKNLNKPDFIHSILAWVSSCNLSKYMSQFILRFKRRTQIETPQMLKQGAVFTPEEMVKLRSDIEHMYTPSWLTSVPINLGEPSHGKLKADQWRALGTTYLPVSLIHLWDMLEDDNQRSRQCKKLLTVTLSLISAVIVASSRTTSHENADLYLHHMQIYLNGLRELFPRYRFLPNQHMALHLAEYLRLYGPVHSWWTFPFERLIGMLQHIPNNFQDGEFHCHIPFALLTFFFRAT